MTRQAFDEFIREANIRTRNSQIDWDEQRDEWLTHLKRFYDLVDEFIADYVDNQQLSVTRSKKNPKRR